MLFRILKEMKRRKGARGGDVHSFMYRMVREDFSSKMTFEQTYKVGVNKPCGYLDNKQKSKCKVPEAEVGLMYSGNIKETRMAEAEREKGSVRR